MHIYLYKYFYPINISIIFNRIINDKFSKGTGNDRMIEMCNTLKECNDSFLNGCFKVVKLYIFICIIIYMIINLIFKLPYPSILKTLVNNNILYLYSFLSIILGSVTQYYLYYFNLWIGVIAITRASYHSTKNYNDYLQLWHPGRLKNTVCCVGKLGVPCKAMRHAVFLTPSAVTHFHPTEMVAIPPVWFC